MLPLTDDNGRFIGIEHAYLEKGESYERVSIKSVSVQPDAVYLELKGTTTRDEAERLRDLYLCVDRAHAVKLPDNTYFIADLVGCSVKDSSGREYGILTDVLKTGANDVYVIEGRQKLMVPALKKLLLQVDTGKKSILFDAHVLEEVGLFED